MISLSQPTMPLIRVIQPELNIFSLQHSIEEYIGEKCLPCFKSGQIVPAMHVSTNSQEHAINLAKYLNQYDDNKLNFEVKQGYFIDYNIDNHFWVQANHVLIDICIQKFKNFPQLEHKIIAELLNYSYLICDNPQDLIYQLYFEDLD